MKKLTLNEVQKQLLRGAVNNKKQVTLADPVEPTLEIPKNEFTEEEHEPMAPKVADSTISVFPFDYFGDSTIDSENYIPKGKDRFAEWKDGDTPYSFSLDTKIKSDALARERREAIKAGMKHAWGGYKKYAFGSDEISPVSGKPHEAWGDIGTTLVDSLDTLWLMDMKEEFWEARDWVRDHLDHAKNRAESVFETTIRSLGGLLSAYDWSQDHAFLDKAVDLGDRLVKAFDTDTGMPFGQINFVTGQGSNAGWTGGSYAFLAEMGTLQIEFRYLAKVTGKKEYADKANHVFEELKKIEPANGLYSYKVTNISPPVRLVGSDIRFGAMGDSFYEYMLKIWLQGGKAEPMYREMYDRSMDGLHDELLQKSTPTGLWYIADKNGNNLHHKMDHLACFMGGLLALGAYTDPNGLQSSRAQRDLKTAKALTYTCYQMYARNPTGIAGELVHFRDNMDMETASNARYYILRPETVESFFILNKLTGDPIYREWGWEMFQSLEKFSRTEYAYGHVHDVTDPNTYAEDKMESFFLAETMKYLYLLFDPDTEIDVLNKHVFNTEAHPMRFFTKL